MVEIRRYSRLAGGRVKDRANRPSGPRGASPLRGRLSAMWRAPWEPLAILFTVASMLYVATYVVSAGGVGQALLQQASPVQGQTVALSFSRCGGGARVTCVVDGDTIWLRGEKIRVADIDTPEISSPQCASELALGQQATQRMTQLLNLGPFEVAPNRGDQTDVYGRSLRVLMRDGQSLGAILVAEGLARRWDGARRSWCG